MIIKKTILVILFLTLTNCGYEAIYSKNDLNLSIKDIQLDGDKAISKKIASSIKIKDDDNNGYQLKLKSNKLLEIISKDKAGKTSIYRTTINVDLSLINKNNVIKKKKFSANFTYNNIENKFELKQYQKNTEENLIKKISKEIFIFLNK
jgi:hypothetical protein|tara:strand:- start:1606 stop:2052 length:447 start_codon:yes stop_codon:yes gene_type:complete